MTASLTRIELIERKLSVENQARAKYAQTLAAQITYQFEKGYAQTEAIRKKYKQPQALV